MAVSAAAHDALAELDEQIRADAAALALQCLAAGYRRDELPVLLRPWRESVAAVRAKAFARLECATVH